MGDCKKYKLKGTPKKAFTGKTLQPNLHNGSAPCKHNTSYAQVSTTIPKLEKSNRKLKHANKKRKRHCESNSNNSYSSRSEGYGSTGKLDNICMKRNKINHCVNAYPSPNNTTNTLDSKRNSILSEKTPDLQSNKDLPNLNYTDTLQE